MLGRTPSHIKQIKAHLFADGSYGVTGHALLDIDLLREEDYSLLSNGEMDYIRQNCFDLSIANH